MSMTYSPQKRLSQGCLVKNKAQIVKWKKDSKLKKKKKYITPLTTVNNRRSKTEKGWEKNQIIGVTLYLQ